MSRPSKPKQNAKTPLQVEAGGLEPRDRSASERDVHARLVKQALAQGTKALYADPMFYDRLYGRRRNDIAFYVECARTHGGPVLELGVGSGRIALALASAGIEVVGVDSMPAMLAAARAGAGALSSRARGCLTLLPGDMRRLELQRRFALVIAPFNAFTHLYSRTDIEDALRGCRRHLARNGRLIFDVVMPDLGALRQNPDRLYVCGRITDPRDGRRYRHLEASHYDPVTQIRTATLLFAPLDGDTATRAIPLTQRQFFPAELEALLAASGFELDARYGDFDRGPLGLTSESQVVIARAVSRSLRVGSAPRGRIC